MKKLKLDPETLSVESFDLSHEERERGTVEGYGTGPIQCTGWASCYGTCPGTCNRDSCYSCSLDSYCETVQWTCVGQETC
ncbi:MAG: hypothetical protein ACJ8GN_30070 [Longimicrobiaceae bacterium]